MHRLDGDGRRDASRMSPKFFSEQPKEQNCHYLKCEKLQELTFFLEELSLDMLGLR